MRLFLRELTKFILTFVMKVDARFVRYVKKGVPYGKSTGLARRIYDQVFEDFLFAETGVTTLSSNYPELNAAFYTLIRENYFTGRLKREYKETIASTFMSEYKCGYCFSVHTLFLDALCSQEIGMAIKRRQFDSILDPKVREHAVWAHSVLDFDPIGGPPPPFPEEHLIEVLALIAASTTAGRVTKIFLGRSPLLLNQTPVMRFLLRLLRSSVRDLIVTVKPGALLDALPKVKITPTNLRWTKSNATIQEVFTRCDATFTRALGERLSLAEQRVVLKATQDHVGMEPPLGRGWMAPYLQEVPTGRHQRVILALLTAVAPHRIVASDLAFGQEDDSPLFIVMWTAFHAGLAMASRIQAQIATAPPIPVKKPKTKRAK